MTHSINDRNQFIRQLGVQSCMAEFGNIDNVKETEIQRRGYEAFIELGKRTPVDSPKTQARQLLKQHVEMLDIAKRESEALAGHVSRITQQTQGSLSLAATIANNPAGLYHPRNRVNQSLSKNKPKQRPKHKK